MNNLGSFTPTETKWIMELLNFTSPLKKAFANQLCNSTLVREYEKNYILILINVDKRLAEPISVNKRIPIELSVTPDSGIPVFFLLHLCKGYLCEIEIYRADSSEIGDINTLLTGKIELHLCNEIENY